MTQDLPVWAFYVITGLLVLCFCFLCAWRAERADRKSAENLCAKIDGERQVAEYELGRCKSEIDELKKDANGRVGRDAKGRFEKVKN